LNGEILRWLETHRHYGIDVLLICQDYRQVTSGVTRVVEMTTKFRRLDRFGFKNRYQAFVRGNPEELEVIRGFTGTYDPKVYAYYGSYATSTKEVRHVRSILRSPSIILGTIGLCVALSWFVLGGGTFGGGSKLPPPPPAAPVTAIPRRTEPAQDIPAVHPIRIQGGMSDLRTGGADWIWVSEDGRLLSIDEIAAESGGSVQATMVRGVKVLRGSGVIWGGAPALASSSGAMLTSDALIAPMRRANPDSSSVRASANEAPAQSVGATQSTDLLATDPKNDLVGQGTDLLR